MTLSGGFDLYRQDVIVYEGQSAKTEESYRSTLNRLLASFGDIEFEAITFDQIRSWKIELCKTRSDNTVRGYIVCLRRVLQHLRVRGYDVLDYTLLRVPKRTVKVPAFLTPQEVRELLRVSFKRAQGYGRINRYRNRAIISLLYASGIRASELMALNRWDIQPDGTFTVVGKGRKARLCFIDERTRTYLQEYLLLRNDIEPALFISPQTGKRMTKHGLKNMFDTMETKVSFRKPLHAHIFRHSFATNLLRNSTNMRELQEFMGHSNLATLQVYTHVVNEDLRATYRKKHTV